MLLRPATPDDLAFVLDSWSRSALQACEAYPADATPFTLEHARAVISDPEAACVVASHDGLPDVIVGWALARRLVLEYVYVKHTARRLGIARELADTLHVIGAAAFTAPWTREYVEARRIVEPFAV